MPNDHRRTSEPSDGLHGNRCYTEVRFFKWQPDEVSVSLRNSGASYGGGSEVLVLESNQNHARAEYTEVSPTLPASMGNGGGYVPMIVEPMAFADDITIKIDGGALPSQSAAGCTTTEYA